MKARNNVQIGRTSAVILRVLPEAEAGVLARALFALVLDGEEPDAAALPASCRAAWKAIREDCDAVLVRSKRNAENGRAAKRPAPKKGRGRNA